MTETQPRKGAEFALSIGLMAVFGGLWLWRAVSRAQRG